MINEINTTLNHIDDGTVDHSNGKQLLNFEAKNKVSKSLKVDGDDKSAMISSSSEVSLGADNVIENNCGILMLNNSEYNLVNMQLAEVFSDYKFVPTKASATISPNNKKRTGLSGSQSMRKRVKPITTSSLPTSRSSRVLPTVENKNSRPPPKRPVPQVSKQNQKWRVNLYKLLEEICQSQKVQPFITTVTPDEPHYSELAGKVLPSPVCSLDKIMPSILNGTFSNLREAYSSVHTVFVCGFRYYEPGSNYWKSALEAAKLFEDKLEEINIKKSLLLEESYSALSTSLVKDLIEQVNNSSQSEVCSEIDSLLMEIIESAKDNGIFLSGYKIEGKCIDKRTEVKRENQPSNMDLTLSEKKPDIKVVENLDPVISDEDRQKFHNLLDKLSPELQYELFLKFEEKAKWKFLDDGDVELDDRATSPSIFLDMLLWCQSTCSQ